MSSPNLLMYGGLTAPWADWIRGELGAGWTVEHMADDDGSDALAGMAARADIIVGGPFSMTAFPATPNLRLFQIPFTGMDWLDVDRLPTGCVVCNTFEHEIAIAEYVLAGMLDVEVDIAAVAARFRSHRWEGRQPGIGPGRGELHGKTLSIVGYGHIGRETARRAQAFGMTVHAVSRRPPEADAVQPDRFSTMQGLDAALAKSDYVLVTLPLDDSTRGLFDTERLATMKSTAVLINVGRGKVIDEQALYEALKDGRIGGAIIDVWYQYPKPDDADPTPSRFPFADLENVIMTPHMSARSQAMRERRWRFVADNLERFRRGEALQNVCFEA